jgi:hypothetical protein
MAGFTAALLPWRKAADVIPAGSSNTITLDTGAVATDDFYNHTKIIVPVGTGIEQERVIVDYVGSTKVATVSPPWIHTENRPGESTDLAVVLHPDGPV